MTTFEHKVDVKQFIKQQGGEHDPKELIKNALEACKKKVEVNYDEGNGILTFFNDGEPLTLDQLQTKVLTAYATGDEKNHDLNRGLGFIVIYEIAEKTIVETGEHKLLINDWQEMHLQNTDQFVKGFKVTVYLNDKYKTRYEYSDIEHMLESWIIFDETKIFFNGKKIGKYLKQPIKTETFKDYWGNFDYCYDQNLFEHEFTALLKLTNINAYQVLDLTYSLKKYVSNPIMNEFVMVFTDSKLLDTSRSGLTYQGRSNLEKCLQDLNKKLSKEMLNNKVLSYGRTALKLFREKLLFIRSQLDLSKDVFSKALESFHWYLTDNEKIDAINHELRYFNKFVDILKLASFKLRLEELEPISIYEVYDREVISFQLKEVDDPSAFNDWFNKRFGFSQHRFFYKETIGMIVEHGEMTSPAKLFHLLERVDYPNFSNWVQFSAELITGGLLEGQTLIAVFTDQFLFYADFPAETELENLVEDRFVALDSDTDTMKEFTLKNKAELDIPTYKPQEVDDETDFLDTESRELLDEINEKFVVDEVELEPMFETLEQFMPKQQAKKILNQIKMRQYFTEVLITKDGTQVLCLVDEATKKRFLEVAKSDKLLERISKGYQMWIEICNLLISNFAEDSDKLKDFVVPAVSFVTNKNEVGCNVKDIIAISHYHVPKVFDPTLAKILKFVKLAAHEIAHLYVSNHSQNFVAFDSSIYYKTVNNNESMKVLRDIFRRK